MRLRDGLKELEQAGEGSEEHARSGRIRSRLAASVARLVPEFPGNARTGVLFEEGKTGDGEEIETREEMEARFDDFANDEVCPVLDLETGRCDLYAARPMTCRTFGPPMRNEEGGLGVCELCFIGATEDEVAASELRPDTESLESTLEADVQEIKGTAGQTLVAFALRS